MQDRPSASELLAAIGEFLQDEVAPQLGDHRSRFRNLVAINLLQMIQRELSASPAQLAAEWASLNQLLGESQPAPDSSRAGAALGERYHQLVALIQQQRPPVGVYEYLLEITRQQVEIGNPGYLQRFEPI